MKKGWIIYNINFEDSEKFYDHITWFIDEAKKQNIVLEAKNNTDILFTLSNTFITSSTLENKPDFIIFFDKDIRLAQSLENIGIRVFNTSNAIEICDDKTLTHIVLTKNNIKTPRTIICPKSFRKLNENEIGFLEHVTKELSFPLVMKEAFGSFGKEVYLINNKDELRNKTLQSSDKPILFQEYVQESRGRDIRLHIVGGEFIGAVVRTNQKDFRANASNGGVMSAYIPTLQEITIAQITCKAIGLDFAGIDILFGKDGPLICEVNSNAHMKNFYMATGINVVKKIISYIDKEIYEST